MNLIQLILLVAAGSIAGFIDSIAGGGGLITLPSLSFVVGPGAPAIATNKIVGAAAALAALLVYARAGHFDIRRSLAFTAFVGLGSFAGGFVSPLIPAQYFKWFLAVTCPLILWIVWNKDLWVSRELAAHLHGEKERPGFRLFAAGAICGFYDGLWGPGGGTFMFLSLLFVARLPLLMALGASKFANTVSALMALTAYASQGLVHWREGIVIAAAIVPAALLGASHATRNASRIVRPVLATVALLLMIKLFARF